MHAIKPKVRTTTSVELKNFKSRLVVYVVVEFE